MTVPAIRTPHPGIPAFVIFLALGLAVAVPVAAQTTQKPTPASATPPTSAASTAAPVNSRADLLKQFSSSLDALSAQVSPSVVQILVTGYRSLDEKDDSETALIGKQRSLGSGVIVDPAGYIITNAHVVKGAQRVRVVLTTPAPNQSQVNTTLSDHLPPKEAKIVGTAPEFDLALLKIDGKDLPALAFADYTQLKKGQLVLAFGNPEGLENSVTMGVISAVARQLETENPFVYIQTDAPINPGNSGGPLVDMDGRLVGLNTVILSESGGSQGLGFAIPSSIVRFVYEQLRTQGHVHHSIIGASLQDITPDLAAGLSLKRQQGVIVADTAPDGPAQKAGLQIQDILLTIEGREIGNVPLAQMIISTRPPGSIVKVTVLRGSQSLSFDIAVADQRNDAERMADAVDPDKSLISRLGIFGVEVNDEIADELGDDLRRPSGVVVVAKAADLLGAETDLEVGDVIHELNGKHIETMDALRAALNALHPGDAVALQIERESKFMYIAFELD
jgi:serine protease Do